MNKKKKIMAISMCSIIGAIALFFILRPIAMKSMNAEVVKEYFTKHYPSANVVSVNKAVYERWDDWWNPVIEDNISAQYAETYTMKYPGKNLTYTVLFSHEPNERMKIEYDTYKYKKKASELYDKYKTQFCDIAKQNECELYVMHGLDDKSVEDKKLVYSILLYAPNAENASITVSDIEKLLENEHPEGEKEQIDSTSSTTYFDLQIPRYVITNDKEMYEKIKKDSYHKYTYSNIDEIYQLTGLWPTLINEDTDILKTFDYTIIPTKWIVIYAESTRKEKAHSSYIYNMDENEQEIQIRISDKTKS